MLRSRRTRPAPDDALSRPLDTVGRHGRPARTGKAGHVQHVRHDRPHIAQPPHSSRPTIRATGTNEPITSRRRQVAAQPAEDSRRVDPWAACSHTPYYRCSCALPRHHSHAHLRPSNLRRLRQTPACPRTHAAFLARHALRCAIGREIVLRVTRLDGPGDEPIPSSQRRQHAAGNIVSRSLPRHALANPSAAPTPTKDTHTSYRTSTRNILPPAQLICRPTRPTPKAYT